MLQLSINKAKTSVAAVFIALLCGAAHAEHLPPQSITAVSRVFGDGRKVETIILEYNTDIRNRSLSAQSYAVEGKDVTRVYATTQPQRALKGADGRFVIIELEAFTDIYAQPKPITDEERALKQERDRMQGGPGLRAGWSTGGNDEYPGDATVTQIADIKTAKGRTITADDTPMHSTREQCLVADDFVQAEFVSPYTGQVLPYNIFIPKNYDPAKKYPLVLFIHDAGVASGPITHTLYQGNGATSWAESEAQARNECFVVAPEYPVITVDDNWNYSHHLDATIALIRALQQQYSIDADRIYTTGQSMGCMSSIVMMLKEPDLFAAALLVAGKWNPSLMAPLADKNVWIISCEGDVSSSTLQGEAVALWRNNGHTVSEATWDMTLSPEHLSAKADEMRADGNSLLFTHLTGGSHRATWFVAYGIPSVQDWLFEQHR
ncbi:MAG: alpha/beta hydrolase-fold protein [Muribaculaceae bacterium]